MSDRISDGRPETARLRSSLFPCEPFAVWFTGLSGSGKTTLARMLEEKLLADRYPCALLDGDELRQGLNRDLGFSLTDREENIRRVSEVARLFTRAGLIVITAFISPLKKDRLNARSLFPAGRFIEVYLDCPLAVCETRDTKGLYRKFRAGQMTGLTGLDSPYEPPDTPELTIRTAVETPAESVKTILQYLNPRLGIRKPDDQT